MKNSEKKIKILENGPYKVSGAVPLNELEFISDTKGHSLDYRETKKYDINDETYHLCRCGKSKNKPFCDGSHITNFNGIETASHKAYDEMASFTEGNLMNLQDAEELCAGARFCDTKSGTWNLVERAENEDAKDIIKHQCANCPSGRLTAITKDGKKIEPDLPKEISMLEDSAAGLHGPIWVKGGIEIEDHTGKTYPTRNRVTLCQCGKSKNKPFCDGNHLRRM